MKLTLPVRHYVHDESAMLPLINLVFLLLVFFMLLGTLSPPQGLHAQPPRARALAPADAGSQRLTLGLDGRMALGTETFDAAVLPARAAAWARANPRRTLQVQADARLEAQPVIATLDVLRRAGIARVSLLAADG